MKKIIFKGVGTAIPTPFTEDGINIPELKNFINYQIENKVDSIIVCGTTGESSTMTKEEKIEVIKCAIETANNKIPIIAGTGSNNTKQAIEMSKIAENLGVNAVLIVTPYYNKTSQKGLIAHYKAINDAINIPIILYNVPSRTRNEHNPRNLLRTLKTKQHCCYKRSKW